MASKSEKADKELSKVLTPEFRVSYPHVFKPNSIKETDPKKYSITMLFPKDCDMSGIKNAIKQAKIAKWGSKDNWPDNLQSPVSDGDDPENKDKEGYAGHWVVKASSSEEQKPGLVNEDVEPILNQGDFYAGCYARAYLYACTWKYMKKEGVMFILDHVQKLHDGKSFGGKKPADQVFSKVGNTKKKAVDQDEEEEPF